MCHAHRGKTLLQEDLRNVEKSTVKKAKVRFRRTREKADIALLVECLEVSQDDTYEVLPVCAGRP